MHQNLSWLLALFILCTTLSAQDSRFHLRVESSIGLSDRSFINDGTVPETIEGIWAGIEKPKLSYDLGVLVEYSVSDRLGLQVGARYADWGFQSDKSELFSSIDDPALPEYTSSKSQNRYLEIPLRLSYYFPLKSSRLNIWGGWYPSYNLSNHTVTTSYYEDRVETDRQEDMPFSLSYRTVNMIAELGFGFEKMVTQNMGFHIGPSIRTQTFGIVEEAPLNRVLFFYGLSAALVFK